MNVNPSEVEPPVGIVPTDTDVKLGKGTPINQHPGNAAFRAMIRERQERYDATPEGQKGRVARELVDSLVGQGWRFLEKTKPHGIWEEVPIERAYRKAQQSLRDGAPQRQEIRLQQQREQRRLLEQETAWVDEHLGRANDDVGSENDTFVGDDVSFHAEFDDGHADDEASE